MPAGAEDELPRMVVTPSPTMNPVAETFALAAEVAAFVLDFVAGSADFDGAEVSLFVHAIKSMTRQTIADTSTC